MFLHVHVVEYDTSVNDERRIVVNVIYMYKLTYSLSAECVGGRNEILTSRTEAIPTHALLVKVQVAGSSVSSVLPRTILSSSPLALALRDQTHRSPSLIYPCASSPRRVQKPTCPSPQLSIRRTDPPLPQRAN